jgi:hypothetical protein
LDKGWVARVERDGGLRVGHVPAGGGGTVSRIEAAGATQRVAIARQRPHDAHE